MENLLPMISNNEFLAKRNKGMQKKMNICFSIMPFEKGFDDIEKIIRSVARDCGLDYVRGDRINQPGSIMPQILHDIRHASVVVADITGNNPNVFYELGIAHHIKGPERVVIIKQKKDTKEVYDVHEFRQLLYTHNEAGRTELRNKLPEYFRKAISTTADQEVWNVVRGRLQRTKLIVRDLKRLVDNAGPEGLKNVTIRVAAGLSSLAISDNEPVDPMDTEYQDQLLLERNTLRRALFLGARLKAILNPPRRFAKTMLPTRLRKRYQRLIGLLEGCSDITNNPQGADEDLAVMKQCEFVLTPTPLPNFFIIDKTIAYEGMKRRGTAGFDMTHCEISADGIKDMITHFDQLFNDSLHEMVRTHPPDGRFAEQLNAFYREAVSSDE